METPEEMSHRRPIGRRLNYIQVAGKVTPKKAGAAAEFISVFSEMIYRLVCPRAKVRERHEKTPLSAGMRNNGAGTEKRPNRTVTRLTHAQVPVNIKFAKITIIPHNTTTHPKPHAPSDSLPIALQWINTWSPLDDPIELRQSRR